MLRFRFGASFCAKFAASASWHVIRTKLPKLFYWIRNSESGKSHDKQHKKHTKVEPQTEGQRGGDKLGQLLKLQPELGICHWICFQSFVSLFFRSLWAFPAKLFAIIKPTMIFLLCCPLALNFDLLGIHVISTPTSPFMLTPCAFILTLPPSLLWCESYVKSFDLFSTFISQSISNLGWKIETAFRN